jgi:hemoglobin/transferrin/lactoferrin receptor protein
MQKRFFLPLVVLPGQLLAQNFLDPLVVTATRSSQVESNTPYTTTYLSARDISENTRRTLPEALQYTPGVLVQKTAHGHGAPVIRGFIGRQNLLMVDGIRINNSTFRGGPVQYWNTVDMLAMDHIELIKSQGSVLYGSDAVGGTLNVFGKSSGFMEEVSGEIFTTGSAAYEFRSNGQGSHIGRIETATGIGGKFGLHLGYSAKDYGDIESNAIGRMEGTGYPEQDHDLRFDWAVTPDSTVTFAHYNLAQEGVSRWHRTLNNPGWKKGDHVAAPGRWTENSFDQDRSLTYLRHAGENPTADAPIQRWSATVSIQDSTDLEFQNRFPERALNNSSVLRRTRIDTRTLGVDLNGQSNLGPGALLYGIDFYRDDVDSSGFQSNAIGGPRKELLAIADDSTYDLLGIYSQYTWKPIESLEITAGARYTHAEAQLGRFTDAAGKPIESSSQQWNSAVGSLRGIYSLDQTWSIYGGISQAFRPPNLDDLTGNQTSRAGTTNLGSLDLEPEKFITYELGTRHNTENTSLNFAIYHTAVEDQIAAAFTDPTLKTAIATNSTDGYSYGVELEGAWRFLPQWTLSGFVSWQDGRTESAAFLGSDEIVDKYGSRLLPFTGSVALRWTADSAKFWVEGRILAANEEDRISEVDQTADNQRIPTNGTPGYVTADLRAGWQVNEHLELTCGIENLTDEDYRNHGSGQNESGLNGIFRAKVSW